MKTEKLKEWLVVALVAIVPRLEAAQEECPVRRSVNHAMRGPLMCTE
jgi:hypothetical protein